MKKLFKSKYENGYNHGFSKGWNEGFDVGSKKAVSEFRKVMIARIQKDIKTNIDHNKNIIAGMAKAIEIIRKIR